MAEIKTGAEIIWECLIREGVEVVFGYPGGNILPTYDALSGYRDKIHHVLVRHEQGATHMADGYARASGKIGVAMATSGPGSTNMVTGIATAMIDSSPIVCITGQVPSWALGGDAFQETDVAGITVPITKHNYLVTRIEELAATLREAFYIARTGRPGPVLIDVTKDVQNASMEFNYPTGPIELPGYHPPDRVPQAQVEAAVRLINEAERPLILAGHGVLLSGAMPELRHLAETGGIPVAMTLLGIGSFPASHPLNLGMMGMHGGAWTNQAIQEADLLIGCGLRFDDRVTGNLKSYAPQAKKIHIDIDAAELNKNVRVEVPIQADLGTALRQINPRVKAGGRRTWLARISDWQEEANERDILQFETRTLLAAQVIRKIWEGTGGAAFVVTDVGQHQMLECQYYGHDEPYTLSSSGGMGTMGFSLPAAIGASFHLKEREIWVIVGDGSIQMTLQELATAVQEQANIKIALINNGYLGMVRQLQEFQYEGRYLETPISSPDYLKLAAAYRLPGYRVRHLDEIIPAMRQAQAHHGPVLIEFVVEPFDNVFPMVLAGADLQAMIRRPHPRFAEMEM